MRLKQKEIKAFRLRMLKDQRNICPLCGNKIKVHEAVLDHDHKTGRIRAVLHRSCNQVEGRVLSWIKRSRGDDAIEFVRALADYWNLPFHGAPLHPTHLTETEKEIKKLKKHKRKLKSKAGKAKVQIVIDSLEGK